MAKTKEEKELEKQNKAPKSYEEQLEELQKAFNPPTFEEIFLSSGSLALDIALGGKGWKLGKQASLVAWWGSGKTTLCLETIAQAEKVNLEYAYIDLEHSIDPVYTANIGINWDRFYKRLFQPNTLEQAVELAKKLIISGCKILVFDSVSGLLPEKMITGEAGSNAVGLQARILGPEVVKLKNLAFANNCLIIYINQIREKVGVMFGSPETAQGGHAIPFFDDYRIEIRKTLEKENGEKEDATGVTSRFKIVKNKVAVPYKSGEYSIKFGIGIDKIKEVIEIGNDLGVIKVWGKVTTYPNDEEGTKFESDKFYQFLSDNPEVLEEIRTKILDKIKE